MLHRSATLRLDSSRSLKVKTTSALFALILVLPLLLSLGFTRQSHAASYVYCEDVVIYQGDGSIYTQTVNLKKKHTSCKIARSVARQWLSGAEGSATEPHPHGFRCRGGDNGMTCRKGNRRVVWTWANQ